MIEIKSWAERNRCANRMWKDGEGCMAVMSHSSSVGEEEGGVCVSERLETVFPQLQVQVRAIQNCPHQGRSQINMFG